MAYKWPDKNNLHTILLSGKSKSGTHLQSLLPTKNFDSPEEKKQPDEGDGTESSYQYGKSY